MAMAVFALIFFIVIQLLCCLKGKRKLVKALPLLIGLLFIGASFALAMWSFSLPSPTNTVEFNRQEEQFSYFLLGLSTGCLTVGGGIFGWLVYGVILLVRGDGGKVLLRALLCVLLLIGAFGVFLHETPDSYMVSFRAVPEDVDRLEVYTFSYAPENRRLIRVITDPDRIERYKEAYRWEDAESICCDEATRYIIYQYASDEYVGASRYSFLLSNYNNYAFNAQQLWLILFP